MLSMQLHLCRLMYFCRGVHVGVEVSDISYIRGEHSVSVAGWSSPD